MDNIKIREANEKDTVQLADLMKQLGYPISLETMLKRIKIYEHDPRYFSFVATINDQVIGSISVAITEYFHREGKFARVVALVVDDGHRKKGVGKRLIQYAEEEVKKYDCSFVELTSGMHRKEMGSHDFYISLGYVDTEGKKKYFVKTI